MHEYSEETDEDVSFYYDACWELVYHEDDDSHDMYGSVDALIAAVEAGRRIKVEVDGVLHEVCPWFQSPFCILIICLMYIGKYLFLFYSIPLLIETASQTYETPLSICICMAYISSLISSSIKQCSNFRTLSLYRLYVHYVVCHSGSQVMETSRR